MEMNYAIGKRPLPVSPSRRLEIAQDELPSIRFLVSAQKSELAKKLFFAVNKQSLRSLLDASFMKPYSPTKTQVTGQRSSSPCCPQEQFSPSSRGNFKQVDHEKSLFGQIRRLVRKVESSYSRSATCKESEVFTLANESLLHVLSMACKADRSAGDFLAQQSPEDIALALLTLSSKKARIHKNSFVELVGAISNKDREDLLKKGSCYFFFVWLLEGCQRPFDAMLQEQHHSSSHHH